MRLGHSDYNLRALAGALLAPPRQPLPAGESGPVFERYSVAIGLRSPLAQEQNAGFQHRALRHIEENPFLAAASNPLSTFSIDVDTASYSNVRRFIEDGSLPPKDAVRIEEMINYFTYDYPQPNDDAAVLGQPRRRVLSLGSRRIGWSGSD